MWLRYKKVINDMKTDMVKNLLLILSIAIGVFGIGTILGGYSVLKREMARNYLSTNPASATIEIEGGTLPRALADSVNALPNVRVAERHATVSARMRVAGEWRRLLLFVIDDFAGKQTNKFTPQTGARIPATGSMLTERTALPVMDIELGDSLLVKTPHGKPSRIAVTGTVHDPSLAPARQEQTGYGYISLETLHTLGEPGGFTELRVLFADSMITRGQIVEQAEQIASAMANQGYRIHEIQVPPPRKHPHQSQSQAVLSMFILFTFLILVLSSILFATAISTLLGKQVREIGIMKTIGANSRHIAGMYAFLVLLLCVVAVVAAIPLSRLAAVQFYSKIAFLLNLEIVDATIPAWVTLVQVAAGVVIPLLAAAIPVAGGSRVSVRQALGNYGVSRRGFSKNAVEGLLSSLSFLNESLRLSIRNIFRKRGRLLMTLALLSAGGAIFMSALNISGAWDANLEKIYKYRHYDLEVRLNTAIDPAPILDKINAISGVKSAEAWGMTTTAFMQGAAFRVVHTYPDQGHGSFMMLATPPQTEQLELPLQAGTWLRDEGENEVVLNQFARAMQPEVNIGDTISLALNGKIDLWRVVGFVEEIGAPATAFVRRAAFQKRSGSRHSNMLRIAFVDRRPEEAQKLIPKIESLLQQEGISVRQSMPLGILNNAMAEHMGVLVNSLLTISVLMGLVGALGLMSAMSMNVLERTREIGVLRAIGATPAKIRKLVIGEGLVTGVISILIAFVLSLPVSFYIGRLIGDLAFRTPLPLRIFPLALVLWVGIIIVGSITATLYPARRAIRISTREALSYE